MEGNQVSVRRGEEYVISRAMYLCNPRFSWREIAQEMTWPSRRVQKLVYFRKLFSSILSIMVTYLLTYLRRWRLDSGFLKRNSQNCWFHKQCRSPDSRGKTFGFPNPDYHNMGRIRNFLFWRLVWIWFVTLRKITSLFYMNFKIYDIKHFLKSVNNKRLLKQSNFQKDLYSL